MGRIRVLVVDDSVVVRRLVADALSSDPAIEVVAVAANGKIGVDKARALDPDLVTMDIEMPVMDGIEAVSTLRRSGWTKPIIMFSTLTERGASATLDALAAGATDYVTKPSNVGSVQQSLQSVAEQLLPRIRSLVPHRGHDAPPRPRPTGPTSSSPAAQGLSARVQGAFAAAGLHGVRSAMPHGPVQLRPRPEAGSRHTRAVIVGSSTGGPEALSKLVRSLDEPLPVPVVIVQHMPPVFTTQLALRLDRMGPSTVVEAVAGVELEPGTIYIAPGDHHLMLRPSASGARTAIDQGPPVNYCRPSVDVMFRSAVEVYKGDLLAVMLTGMGADGRSGTEDVVTAGGVVLAQDEGSSVVWGMPGAVASAGLAHRVLPIDEIGPAIVREVAA